MRHYTTIVGIRISETIIDISFYTVSINSCIGFARYKQTLLCQSRMIEAQRVISSCPYIKRYIQIDFEILFKIMTGALNLFKKWRHLLYCSRQNTSEATDILKQKRLDQ